VQINDNYIYIYCIEVVHQSTTLRLAWGGPGPSEAWRVPFSPTVSCRRVSANAPVLIRNAKSSRRWALVWAQDWALGSMLVELFLFMRLFSPVFLSEPRSVEQMCPMRLRIGVMILVLFLSCFVQRMRGSFDLCTCRPRSAGLNGVAMLIFKSQDRCGTLAAPAVGVPVGSAESLCLSVLCRFFFSIRFGMK